VLHDEVLFITFAEMVADLRQHRVAHTGKNSCLALESVAQHFIAGKECTFEGNSTA
jgi:hypothetical protein